MGDQECEVLVQKMTIGSRSPSSTTDTKSPGPGSPSSTTPSTTTTTTNSTAKKPSWKKDYALPPCKVCGGDGSGIHYGVNTCEACKGFFRRSLARKETYRCRQNQKCNLEAGKRNMCSACRFRKCLDVGMSTGGIKIGRYTTEKRRQDTVEVKQIKAEKSVVSRKEKEKTKEKSLVELIETVVDAGRKNFDNIDHLHEELAVLQEEINTKSKTQRDLVNALEIMSTEDFENFLQDLEPQKPDMKEIMFNKCLKFLELIIRKYIKFAKAVPGFKTLPIDDQVALIKASHGDITTIYKYQFRNDAKRIAPSDGQTLIFTKMCDNMPQEHDKTILALRAKFRNLELAEEELHLVHAMLLVSPDRCELEERERAAAVQQDIVDGLQWLMKRNHDAPQMLFAHLISFVTEMRSFEEVRREMTHRCIRHMKACTEKPGVLSTVPALIWEIADLAEIVDA